MVLAFASRRLLDFASMSGSLSRRALAIALFLIAVALIAAGVWWFAFTAALTQLDERGRADLALSSDRLGGQLQRFRDVAVLLSDHPTLVPLVLGQGGAEKGASELLLGMADKTGSLNIQLFGEDRLLLASAGSGVLKTGAVAAYERALDGALGAALFVDDQGRRIFSFASPVFQPFGPSQGTVLVSVDIETIEANWPNDPSPVFFTDENGVVFVTNRSELTLTDRSHTPNEPTAGRPPLFPHFEERLIDTHSLWIWDAGPYLPRRALHLTQPLPVINMTGEILVDLSPVSRIAFLQSAVAAALCLAFGALLFLATERRRALSDRLAVEAAANAELEARVQARTRDLSAANKSLRREVGERQEAEAALRKAQADLVQAGKLSALGQMSAGISHELNQPLMAIRSFAENAEEFLTRGKPEVAAENLSRISDLARRMGRIIKNLRAFSRQEKEAIGDVDLVGVVDVVLELAETRIRAEEVTLVWQRPDIPMIVRGGEVRLQQVVMNLVSNALDAMLDADQRSLVLAIEPAGALVRLTVRDTGAGIADPAKIFDPFYSTKEVGQSEGMGLGLSISYGIVQSFGGAIQGRNHPDGGAIFTMDLTASGLEQAA
jgi:two-component system C4-dicarboxylate transport sensor histidine kinase DctB